MKIKTNSGCHLSVLSKGIEITYVLMIFLEDTEDGRADSFEAGRAASPNTEDIRERQPGTGQSQ
jgi:hypothetical protein